MTCTNPASGARWQIRIDYERSTVDSYPARITDAHISWRDSSDGGNYTLDRRSGKLTVPSPRALAAISSLIIASLIIEDVVAVRPPVVLLSLLSALPAGWPFEHLPPPRAWSGGNG